MKQVLCDICKQDARPHPNLNPVLDPLHLSFGDPYFTAPVIFKLVCIPCSKAIKSSVLAAIELRKV